MEGRIVRVSAEGFVCDPFLNISLEVRTIWLLDPRCFIPTYDRSDLLLDFVKQSATNYLRDCRDTVVLSVTCRGHYRHVVPAVRVR